MDCCARTNALDCSEESRNSVYKHTGLQPVKRSPLPCTKGSLAPPLLPGKAILSEAVLTLTAFMPKS